MLGKDKEEHEDRRAIYAFHELLSDLRSDFKNQIELDCHKKLMTYALPVFIMGSTSVPSKVIGAVRDCFLHVLETPSFVDKNELQKTIKWFISKTFCHKSNFDLESWIEKSCHGVNRSIADYQTIFAFAVRLVNG